MIKRSYAFRWTAYDGQVSGIQGQLIDVEDIQSLRNEWFRCFRLALEAGWTEPKWWEWWRANDAPRTAALPKELKP